jgi:hypothetical protein
MTAGPPPDVKQPQAGRVVPMIPLIVPPNIACQAEWSPMSSEALILAGMSASPDQWQVVSAPLEKYAKQELFEKWTSYLRSPPNLTIEHRELESCKGFSQDEDFALLVFMRSSAKFCDFMRIYGFLFKPFRSDQSLFHRIEYLKTIDQDEFYSSYAHLILNEQIFHLAARETANDPAIFSQAVCSFVLDQASVAPTDEVSEEIGSLVKDMRGLAFSSAEKLPALAILRSEHNEYLMVRQAIVIGRGTADHDVDIDLTFESDRNCCHISRAQAVLSFLEDGFFYVENVGNRAFRVNGLLIESGAMCQLPPGALLDFSGALLMFIPNESLVADIKSALDSAQGNARKR